MVDAVSDVTGAACQAIAQEGWEGLHMVKGQVGWLLGTCRSALVFRDGHVRQFGALFEIVGSSAGAEAAQPGENHVAGIIAIDTLIQKAEFIFVSRRMT